MMSGDDDDDLKPKEGEDQGGEDLYPDSFAESPQVAYNRKQAARIISDIRNHRDYEDIIDALAMAKNPKDARNILIGYKLITKEGGQPKTSASLLLGDDEEGQELADFSGTKAPEGIAIPALNTIIQYAQNERSGNYKQRIKNSIDKLKPTDLDKDSDTPLLEVIANSKMKGGLVRCIRDNRSKLGNLTDDEIKNLVQPDIVFINAYASEVLRKRRAIDNLSSRISAAPQYIFNDLLAAQDINQLKQALTTHGFSKIYIGELNSNADYDELTAVAAKAYVSNHLIEDATTRNFLTASQIEALARLLPDNTKNQFATFERALISYLDKTYPDPILNTIRSMDNRETQDLFLDIQRRNLIEKVGDYIAQPSPSIAILLQLSNKNGLEDFLKNDAPAKTALGITHISRQAIESLPPPTINELSQQATAASQNLILHDAGVITTLSTLANQISLLNAIQTLDPQNTGDYTNIKQALCALHLNIQGTPIPDAIIMQLSNQNVDGLYDSAKRAVKAEVIQAATAELLNFDVQIRILNAIQTLDPQSSQDFVNIKRALCALHLTSAQGTPIPDKIIMDLTNIDVTQLYDSAKRNVSTEMARRAVEQIRDLVNDNDPILAAIETASAQQTPQAAAVPVLTQYKHDLNLEIFDPNNNLADISPNIISKIDPQDLDTIFQATQKQIAANRVTADLTNRIDTGSFSAAFNLAQLSGLDLGNPNDIATFKNALHQEFNTQKLYLNFLSDDQLQSIQDRIQARVVSQQINTHLLQIKNPNDPLLRAIMDKDINNPQELAALKSLLFNHGANLGIGWARPEIIDGLTTRYIEKLQKRAGTQYVTNQVIHSAQQITNNNDIVLQTLPNTVVQTILGNKATLGVNGVNNSYINRLSQDQQDAIGKAANVQISINDIKYQTSILAAAPDPIFAVVNPPTNHEGTIKTRLKAAFPNTNPTFIDAFTPGETQSIYQAIAAKEQTLNPYSTLIHKFADDPQRLALFTVPPPNPLQAHIANLAGGAQAFVDSLIDPSKTQAQIRTILAAIPAFSNPPPDPAPLAEALFADNQYRRINAVSFIKARLDLLRTNQNMGGVLDELGQKDRPADVDALVTAIKDARTLPALHNAMDALALARGGDSDLFAEIEYIRLLAKHDQHPFLKPLLEANAQGIKTAIATGVSVGQITTSESVDQRIDRIMTSDRNTIIGECANLGITHTNNPVAGSPPVPFTPQADDILFAKKSVYQLHSKLGDTLANMIDETVVNQLVPGVGAAPRRFTTNASIQGVIGGLQDTDKNNLGEAIHTKLDIDEFLGDDEAQAQIFAEIQYQKIIDDPTLEPKLKAQLAAHKDEIIEALTDEDYGFNTSRQVRDHVEALKNAITDSDAYLAARDLGFTLTNTQEIVAENKQHRLVAAQREQFTPEDTLHPDRAYPRDIRFINMNKESYYKRLDYFLSQSKEALNAVSDKNHIEKIEKATHELQIQLTKYQHYLITFSNYLLANPDKGNLNLRTKVTAEINQLENYLDPNNGIIKQIEDNIRIVKARVAPVQPAYYQPIVNVANAEDANDYKDALRKLARHFGTTDVAPAAGGVALGLQAKTLPPGTTVSLIPMDIRVSPTKVLHSASVNTRYPQGKGAKLDFYFKNLDVLKNIPRERSTFKITSIPGLEVMEWAAANIKTLKNLCKANDTIHITDNGLPKDCVEALKLYCAYKGFKCSPEANDISKKQIALFTELWTARYPNDIGAKEEKELEVKTTPKLTS